MTQPASEARVVLERFFHRVYRERDAGAIAEMRDDGAGSVGLGPGILSNADFERFVRGLFASFSALEVTIGRFLQQGDECAMSLVFSGLVASTARFTIESFGCPCNIPSGGNSGRNPAIRSAAASSATGS